VTSAWAVPLTIKDFIQMIYGYFKAHPMTTRHGDLIKPRKTKVTTVEEYNNRQSKLRGLLAIPSFFNRSAKSALRGLSRLDKYHAIYMPYYRYEAIFRTDNLLKLWSSLSGADHAKFDFDVRQIDYQYWLTDIHLPGLRKYALGGR